MLYADVTIEETVHALSPVENQHGALQRACWFLCCCALFTQKLSHRLLHLCRFLCSFDICGTTDNEEHVHMYNVGWIRQIYSERCLRKRRFFQISRKSAFFDFVYLGLHMRNCKSAYANVSSITHICRNQLQNECSFVHWSKIEHEMFRFTSLKAAKRLETCAFFSYVIIGRLSTHALVTKNQHFQRTHA
jgi:hypothetical protein